MLKEGAKQSKAEVTEQNWEVAREVDYEDLLHIFQKSLALRHVSSSKVAKQEKKDGISGDALALANFAHLLRKEDREKLLELPLIKMASGYNLGLVRLLETFPVILEQLDDETKYHLVADFNRQLKAFIATSLAWDINKFFNEKTPTVRDVVGQLINLSPSFLLAIFKERGYDQENYYGLGKCGRQQVKPQDIVGIFSLSADDFVDLKLASNQLVGRDEFENIVGVAADKMYQKFTALVKGGRLD